MTTPTPKTHRESKRVASRSSVSPTPPSVPLAAPLRFGTWMNPDADITGGSDPPKQLVTEANVAAILGEFPAYVAYRRPIEEWRLAQARADVANGGARMRLPNSPQYRPSPKALSAAVSSAEYMVGCAERQFAQLRAYAETLPTHRYPLTLIADIYRHTGGGAVGVAYALARLAPPVRWLNHNVQVWDGARWRPATQKTAVSTLAQWLEAEEPLSRLADIPLLAAGVVTYSSDRDDDRYGIATIGKYGEYGGYDEYGAYHEGHSNGEQEYELEEWERLWVAHTRFGESQEKAVIRMLKRRDGGLLEALQRDPAVQVQVTPFEEQNALEMDEPGYLNTPDGVYDLRTGQRLPDGVARQKGMTRVAGATPAAVGDATTCPLFQATLARALPDPAERDWLLLFSGAALTGEAWTDRSLWLYGDGGTGKSTVTDGILAALGEYAAPIDTTALLVGKRTEASRKLLRGRRLGLLSEADRRHHIDAGFFKSLTNSFQSGGAGEAKWKRQHLLAVETNTMPRFGDETRGIARRVTVAPFLHPIPDDEVDGTVRARVKGEASGILRLLMDEAQRYYADPQALERVPRTMVAATTKALVGENPEAYFYGLLQPTEGQPMPVGEAYARLVDICKRSGRPVPTRKAMKAELERRGFTLREGRARTLYLWARFQEDGKKGDVESAS